jgi:hypothetical protein
MTRRGSRPPSRRDHIRDFVERFLRERGSPVPIKELARVALRELNLTEVTQHDINTALHDDPLFRFRTVERGVWTLK